MKAINEVRVYALKALQMTPMPQCLAEPKLKCRYLCTGQAGRE